MRYFALQANGKWYVYYKVERMAQAIFHSGPYDNEITAGKKIREILSAEQ